MRGPLSEEAYGDTVKKLDMELMKPLPGRDVDDVPEEVVQDEMAQFRQAAATAMTAQG